MNGYGAGSTVIVAVANDVQPSASPSTVYTAVDDGLSVMVLPLDAEFHVYDAAPEALTVPVCRGQIEALDVVMTGFVTNPTRIVLLAMQLFASVAVTVYKNVPLFDCVTVCVLDAGPFVH